MVTVKIQVVGVLHLVQQHGHIGTSPKYFVTFGSQTTLAMQIGGYSMISFEETIFIIFLLKKDDFVEKKHQYS